MENLKTRDEIETLDDAVEQVRTEVRNILTWDEGIVSFLKEHPHKGRPHSPHRCPVAKALQFHLPSSFTASVTHSRIRIKQKGWDGRMRKMSDIPTPPEIEHFLTQFDRGDYPELELGCND